MKTCSDCGYEYELFTCQCSWKSPTFHGYDLATIDDFDPEVVRAVVKDLTSSRTKSVLLYGPPGNGKTHLAISITKYFENETGKSVAIIKPYQFSKLPSEYDKQIKSATNVDLLIIDEFNNDCFGILNDRNQLGLPTICTSNAQLSSLDGRFSWRLKRYLMDSLDIDINEEYEKKISLYEKWESYIESVNRSNIEQIVDSIESYSKIPSCSYTGMVETDTQISWMTHDGRMNYKFKNI
jgi:energy-coupling factor transporter ATP-binding protein EcfA2